MYVVSSKVLNMQKEASSAVADWAPRAGGSDPAREPINQSTYKGERNY